MEFLSFSSHTMVQNIILSPFQHPFVPSFQRRVLHQVFHWLQVENAMKKPGLPYLHHSLSSSPSCGERSGVFPPLLRLRVQRSKLPCFLPNYLLHSLSSPLSPPGESALCCSSSSQPPPPAPQPLIILHTAQTHKRSLCTNAETIQVPKAQSTEHCSQHTTHHTIHNLKCTMYKYFREILCQEGLRTHDDDVKEMF